jgi:hypothetical protein
VQLRASVVRGAEAFAARQDDRASRPLLEVLAGASVSCKHPPAAELPWLVCRTCGVWDEGKRLGPFSTEDLKAALQRASDEGREVQLHPVPLLDAREGEEFSS